jgi:undecaprenyl-diphosphatase
MTSAHISRRWVGQASSAWRWLRDHKHFVVMIAMLIVVAGVWFFIALADEVLEGDTQHFDNRVMQWLQRPAASVDPNAAPSTLPIGPPWLREVGRDLTALGGVAVMSLVTFAVAGFLAVSGKYRAMGLMLLATFGGLLLSTILKQLSDRPRPNVSHFAYVYTSSFPSGHSMLSAIVYLTLGSMLTRLVPNRIEKFYCLGVAMLLTFLVGISRVYMGVHYPTDVLAGWTAGLVWAVICWLLTRVLQKRGRVEKDSDPRRDDTPINS